MNAYPMEVTIEEGQELILNRCVRMEREEVPVEEAAGRVLADSIYSGENLPPFARSPLDGYAFRACDAAGASKEHPVTLRIIEEVPAGQVPVKTVREKEAVKILTGAPVPDGADVIEKYEAVSFTEETVTLYREYRPDTNIVPAGEDIREGELVLEKGTLLSPSDAGLLAGLGYQRLPVYARPKAVLISTGDELIPAEAPLTKGKIRNSSSYALKGYLELAGAEAALAGIIPDNEEIIAGRIREAAAEADMIVTTGGVSVGDYDCILRSLELLGAEILFWKVQMKPGMAFLAAVYEGKLLLGLSGNPSSAAVSLFMLGLPAVRKAAGRQESEILPQKLKVRLSKGFPKKSPGRRLLPGRLVIRDGLAYLDLETRQGNGMLHPLHACDLLGELPAGSPPMEADAPIAAWKIFEKNGKKRGEKMQDSFGRTIDYLRVSVTDRCNLRCVYCMPEEGVKMTTHENLLSYDEIIRVCRIVAGMGFKKIKLTGGEPLARKNVPALVRELKQIEGIEKVTLTTNGVALGGCAEELAAAGLDGVNISLDTTNPELFREITRRDALPRVLEGIQSVLGREGLSVKINCVPLGRKEQNLAAMAAFAREYPVHVRFIEMMPVGYGKDFSFIGEEDIKALLEAEYGTLHPFRGRLGNGPCRYYEIDGFQGKVGFISAISHKFCDRCNRVRLTSQGFLKTCLQYDTGRDLRGMLRSGAGNEEIAAVIAAAVEGKPGSHHFLEKDIRDENSMCMSQIGG